ncbi:MAG: hypothetical protein ABH860_01950 [bacterium]
MKKVFIVFIIVSLIVSCSSAAKKSFKVESVIWVMNDGSTERGEKVVKTRSFEVENGYVYDSGIRTDGQSFGTDVPFKIYTSNQDAVLSNKIFGMVRNSFAKEKIESVISAITIHSGTRPLAETLILGETFYVMSRPLVAYNGFIVETGKLID